MRAGWIGALVAGLAGVAQAQQGAEGSLAIPMPGADGRIVVSREMLIRSGATSLGEALAGQVAGLHLMFASNPTGALPSAVMRTPYALAGQGAPLVLIDDLPVSVAVGRGRTVTQGHSWWQLLADMPLAEIESVAILKGLDATARYGPRAFSGAIAITSRRPSRTGAWFGASQRTGISARASEFETRRFTREEAMASPFGGSTAAEAGASWDACRGFCDFQDELLGGIRSFAHADLTGGVRNPSTAVQGSLTARRTGLAVRGTSDDYLAGRASLHKAWWGGTLDVSHMISQTQGHRSWENADASPATSAGTLQRWPSWYDLGNAPLSFASGNPIWLMRNMEAPRTQGLYFTSLHLRSPALRGAGHELRARLEGSLQRSTQRDTTLTPDFSITLESVARSELYRAMLEHEVGAFGGHIRSLFAREINRRRIDLSDRSGCPGCEVGARANSQIRDSLAGWWLTSSWSSPGGNRRFSGMLRHDDAFRTGRLGWQVGAFLRRDSAGASLRVSAGDVSTKREAQDADIAFYDPRSWERRRELEAEATIPIGGRARAYLTVFRSLTSNAFVGVFFTPGGGSVTTTTRLEALGFESGINVMLHASGSSSLVSGLSVAHARTRSRDDAGGRAALVGAYGVGKTGRSITAYAVRDTLDVFKSTVIGDAWPLVTLTQRNDARWRRWRFTSSMDAQLGVDLPNFDRYLADRFFTSPSPDGGAARAAAGGRNEPVYLEDASFVRLREVVASVPLHTRWAGNELRFEVALRNAFTWSGFDNLDPTVRNRVSVASGPLGAIAGVPIMRSLSVALVYGI